MDDKIHIRIAVNFLAKMTFALVTIFSVPILKEYLGLAGYGIVTFFLSLQVLVLLMEGGMSATLARGLLNNVYIKHGISKERYSTFYFLFFICISVLVIFVFYTFNSYVITIISLSEYTTLIGWLTPTQLIITAGSIVSVQFFVIYYEAIYIAHEKQIAYSIQTIVYNLIKTVISLYCVVYIKPSLDIFLVSQLCSMILYVVILHCYAVSQRIIKLSFRYVSSVMLIPGFLKSEFRFGKNILLVAVLSALAYQSDRIFITKNMGVNLAGIYGMAYTLSAVPALFTSSLYNVIYPRLIMMLKLKQKDAFEFYHFVYKAVYILIIPVCLVIGYNSESILNLWMGKTEVLTSQLLTWLIIATLLQGLQVIPYALQMAQEWLRFTVIMNFILVPILLVSYYVISSHSTILYMAYAWLGYNLVSYLAVTLFIYYKNKMFSKLMVAYIQIIICSLVTVITCISLAKNYNENILVITNLVLQFCVSFFSMIILLFWKKLFGAIKCFCFR